ncbi:MAG: IclR family transcriptional regulator [Casimicrobiaceae bacterium]
MDTGAPSSADHSAAPPDGRRPDAMAVQSVEKAFRILGAFNGANPSLGLTQLALRVGLDKSAIQRFTHTLVRLGYLRKDPDTKRFELTAKTLDVGYLYLRGNALVERALPYLLHISKTTEETVNLTVPDGTEIVFIARFMSRHVLQTDVIVGTRMPAYCTAPGVAMLSRLPQEDAHRILGQSALQAHTAHTTYRTGDLAKKIAHSAARGYATAFEEFYLGDLSIAAAIVDRGGRPIGAVNIGVSRARFTPDEAERRFAPLVVAAARSISYPSDAKP